MKHNRKERKYTNIQINLHCNFQKKRNIHLNCHNRLNRYHKLSLEEIYALPKEIDEVNAFPTFLPGLLLAATAGLVVTGTPDGLVVGRAVATGAVVVDDFPCESLDLVVVGLLLLLVDDVEV
jgi:hypothetical protein